MIKPNELRIGNLVQYEGRIFQIATIAPEFPTLNTDEFGIGVVSWEEIDRKNKLNTSLRKAGSYGAVG